MRAMRLEHVGDAVIRTVAEPQPGPGEITVEVVRAGICGSDRHLIDGRAARNVTMKFVVRSTMMA